ncbi:hypothetical protein JCM10908_005814 [Rhodotorula pacifica]|uniref:peptide-methionine (R)-S-oxide reductase n=1 Tax=Rhodotorula pacifica TaxID=1495444 RepID=UPI00317EEC42
MLVRRAITAVKRNPSTFIAASTGALALSYFASQSATLHLNPRFFGTSTLANQSAMSYPIKKSDAEWQATLTPQQFKILREKGTEMAGTGEYDKHYPDKGVYECAGCGTPLYTADMKFKSGCGWPAFFDAIPGAITEITDRSWGMERTEIVCSKCGGHQGHVFRNEGFSNPTSDRHCVNSVSIRYNPDKQAKWEKYSKDAAK